MTDATSEREKDPNNVEEEVNGLNTVATEVEGVEAEAENENVENLKADNDSDASAADQENKKEEDDFKSKYFYLAAEIENLRKRHEREKQNLLKYGNEKVLSSLLEVMDNFDRTTDAISNDEDEKVKNILTGIEMVRKQFFDVLKDNGLEQIESLGKTFDPNVHEAMGGTAGRR